MARAARELVARLSAARWLLLAVAVILAALVALTDLPGFPALLGYVAFGASAAFLPRYAIDASTGALLSPVAAPQASAMHVMAEALPDPILLLNASGQILSSNAPARRLFGSLREGNHISSAIRTPEFLDAVLAAPDRGRVITVTYAERVPVGRRMEATVAPIEGAPDGGTILVLLRDLTEVERINQMRADFIANASHELRTPLASLRGFIETLQLSLIHI